MTVPGISVISPSYGPQSRTSAAEAVLPKLHALLGPFLVAPAASAPPEPDPRALMQDGAERVEAYLAGRTDLPAVPGQVVALGADYQRQFDQVRRSSDYSVEGQRRQFAATFDQLGTGLTSQGQRLVRDFGVVLKGWPLLRDPGKAWLLGTGTPADVVALVGLVAPAPLRVGLTLLQQLTPVDPADRGDQLRRENVAATLWARRAEWQTDPRLGEEVVAAFRRMQRHDRSAEFYAGFYAQARVDGMAQAWLAAANALLLHGLLDPAERAPLEAAFARPADPLAVVRAALPAPEAVDVLAGYGLRPADVMGPVGAARSSEAVGPVRLAERAGAAAT